MSAFFTVTKKELQDHFNSWRFFVILGIIVVAVIFGFYAARDLHGVITGSTDFPFLYTFFFQFFNLSNSTAANIVPTSFVDLMAVLLPVAGIVLGLDAINSERNNGTLSRLVSQPIYRDNIINAKFLAGLITLSVTLLASVLLVSAVSIRITGIPPTSEETLRLFFFVVIGIIYSGFWLGLAILFSTLFRQVAVSAVVTVLVWVFFAFFFPLIYTNIMQSADSVGKVQDAITIARVSPIFLFSDSMRAILIPVGWTQSQVIIYLSSDISSYFMGNPLTIAQSLLVVWPQIILILVLTVVCFAISYIKFMFEEIRAI